MTLSRTALCCWLVAAHALAAPPEQVDFQRDVKPILTDACFHCHGPDKETRMAGLRLDTREDAVAVRKSGAAIVEGMPEQSLLWQRINHASPARKMPPPYSHKTLTEEQKRILRSWIEQGAPYQQHWAFVRPVRAPLPKVSQPAWIRNPIDRFVLARMEKAGLSPAPEASQRTLIRRVALDLTGLPPAPEEVAAFLADPAPDAYEKMVGRYLASPHYGEHRARYWLDAARYADTHGIHIDNYREMWPYRDWVINAFNRNLPFDRFTIEQIAGDLLPNPTLEQRIASGFHRCNATTNEAGVILEEIDAMYTKDRVDTTSAVFLGLTLGCATCHDHKFDPLTQRDFYSLGAFFRNTIQPVMDGNVPDSPPVLAVPSHEDMPRWTTLQDERVKLRTGMRRMAEQRDAAFESWVRSPERRQITQPLGLTGQAFQLIPALVQAPAGVRIAPSLYPTVPALHFSEKAFLELPNQPVFDADRAFAISVWFLFPTGEDRFVVASQNDPEDKGRGWQISIGARVSTFRLTGDEGKSISISTGHLEQVRPGTWNHLIVSYDGSREQPGLRIYLNGQTAAGQGGDHRNRLKGSVNTGRPLWLARESKSYFQGGAIGDFRIFSRIILPEEARLLAAWPTALAARRTPTPKLAPDERSALRLYHLMRLNPAYRQMVARMNRLETETAIIARRSPVTHVMEERTDQKPFAHILHRGMYDQPRERVEPATPAVLPAMKPGLPRNRLGLAQWLVDEDHPLTARVTVNRFWQEIFGVGLVKTADDFGSQGEVPVNQDLLDWLAVEFRESGWDVKKLIRLMVTSAAYRQAALTTPAKLLADPENRLLSRGPRFRMDGEMVRDYALAASGLLNRAIGGPSVKPYQPEGVWEAVAMLGSNTRFYKPDEGDKLYRRSLYWFWKRSAPPASMEIFGAPSREFCTVRRERTNTPLQALVTMNDTQFVEAARILAQGVMRSGASASAPRLDALAERLLARTLKDPEKLSALAAYKDFLNYYDSHPSDAAKLLAIGAAPRDETLNAAELAALTMVANQLLNLDEVLNK